MHDGSCNKLHVTVVTLMSDLISVTNIHCASSCPMLKHTYFTVSHMFNGS